MIRRVWTSERDKLLAAELPDNTDPDALLAALNALPGDPIASKEALKVYAQKHGLKRNPEAALAIQRRSGLAANALRLARRGGRNELVWTEARNLRLIEARRIGEQDADTLAVLNAMPGPPVASTHSMRGQLKKLRARGYEIPKRLPGPLVGTQPKSPPPVRVKAAEPVPEPVVVEPPPPPKPCPELADAAAEARLARLKDSVKRSMKKGRLEWESAVAIANRHGVTPRRVLIVLGMVRS